MPHKAKGEALGFDQEAETGAKGKAKRSRINSLR